MATEVAAPVAFPMTSPRRLQRGSRYSAHPQPGPPPSLSSLESAFQLQEYISQLIKRDPEDIEAIVKLPASTTTASDQSNESATSSQDTPDVDQSCWVYEHLRRLAQDLTYPLITLLQAECTRQTCPEMKAGEWLYLCVAHGNGGNMEQCCAIDYILHTLDSATALLNSSRNFPSRIAIPINSTRHFSSLARRLSRVFAHAYFHHRELFEQAESENALYERFLGLVNEFQLVPAEFLVINWEGRPARKPKNTYAQGGSEAQYIEERNPSEAAPTILRREASGSESLSANVGEDANLMASPSGGSLSRRRTDTMYMTGDVLAALDPVLSGEAFANGAEPTLEDLQASSAAAHEAEDNQEEMVESVDPFTDSNEVEPSPSEEKVGEDVAVLGDDENVPDVEDAVVPIKEEDDWPDVEVLEEEAAEASAEGQKTEEIVAEPLPTPVDENTPEVVDTPAEDAKTEETATAETEAGAESEAGATRPEDKEAVEKMLMDLEEERKEKLGVVAAEDAAAAE